MAKIADSYFIDSDTGKRIPVRMEYTGVFKPDTTMITAHNVYRLNNGVAEKLEGSGWRQPNTDDPNYWKTNIRQAAKNQEEPQNSVKYYWNKFTNWIKEDKNGGNMNYASYLEGGGAAPQNAAPQVSKEDIAEIITAALNGTGEIKQQATAALQEMMQDASIAPLVEQVMSEMGIPSQKCGGRVKKKEMGSKLVKAEKAKCGCALKKVGGRLIEVDTCTGLPIHRNGGMVKKYQNTPGPITYVNRAIDPNTTENNLTAAIKDSFHTGNVPLLTGNNVAAGYQTLSDGRTVVKVRYTNGEAYPAYEYVDGDRTRLVSNPKQFTPLEDGSYAFIDDNGDLYFNNGRYKDAATGKMNNYDPMSFFDRSPNNISALRAHGFLMGPLSTKQTIDNQHEDTPTWRDTFGAGKAGKFGGLTYDQALARQQEMLNADWFNANLGTSGATKRGDDGMWGQTSQKEWARYLAEKQRREEQAAAAEAERQELNNLPASSIRRTTSDGMTNEALLAMDAGKAMSTLSRPDYERWMKLNQYQQGRNAALVYNGKRYNDEAAYNAAVDAETARTAPQLDMQNLLNIRGKRRRNDAYAQYQASVAKHAANNPYYSGPKALTQEQLSATSFKNGGQLNYANYLN